MLNELKEAVNKGTNRHINDHHARQHMLNWIDEKYGKLDEADAEALLKREFERWETLKNRLADEISRGFSISRIANETALDVVHIHAWAKDFTHFRIARRVGDESQADLIERALEQRFQEIDQERSTQRRREPGRIETSVIREVTAAIGRAREFAVIVDISAPSGSGKSEGVEEYLARIRKAEGFECPVWKVTLKPSHSTTKSLLELIARECVGTVHESRSEGRVFDDIMSATQGRGGVLIVDEAQQMADAKNANGIAMINTLRSFVDAKAFGVALIGNNEIYRRLNKENAFQILGRMSPWRVDIKGASEEDIDDLIRAWGVTGKRERDMCHKIVRGGGGLHKLIGTFKASLGSFDEINADTLAVFAKG